MYHETHQQTPIKKKHPEKYWRILPDELTLKCLFGDKR